MLFEIVRSFFNNMDLSLKEKIMENTTLEITNVKIYTLENNDSKLRAFAHIVINNALKITGLKVIEEKSYREIALRRGSSGEDDC